MTEIPAKRPHTSRQRYDEFVDDYRHRRLDDLTDARSGRTKKETDEETRKQRRREYIREYLRWLKPHRQRVGLVFGLAVIGAAIQLVEPLFMRHIIDKVLLNTELDAAQRVRRLNLIGATFLAVIIFSNLVNVLKDYRQRLLNTRVMLSLRRSLLQARPQRRIGTIGLCR